MLDLTILDRAIAAFSIALDGAYAALHLYSLGLLGTLAFIYYGLRMGGLVMRPSYASEGLSELVWTVLKIGGFYWLLEVLYDLMWNRAFPTFVQWGADASGGTFNATTFLQPSTILIAGYQAAWPLKVFADQFIGPLLPLYLVDLSLTMLAYWVTIVAFGAIALHIMVTLIEFKLAVATGAVLIPWAMLTHTAVLGELSLSWLTAGLVRVFMTVIIAGIAMPLFQVLTVPVATDGVDPSVVQVTLLAIVAVIFAILAWVIPNRVAGLAGRGMALGLTGEHLISGSMTALGGIRASARMAQGAIHGVSRLRAA
jgi:type IV secretory pathway TrbL component